MADLGGPEQALQTFAERRARLIHKDTPSCQGIEWGGYIACRERYSEKRIRFCMEKVRSSNLKSALRWGLAFAQGK